MVNLNCEVSCRVVAAMAHATNASRAEPDGRKRLALGRFKGQEGASRVDEGSLALHSMRACVENKDGTFEGGWMYE